MSWFNESKLSNRKQFFKTGNVVFDNYYFDSKNNKLVSTNTRILNVLEMTKQEADFANGKQCILKYNNDFLEVDEYFYARYENVLKVENPTFKKSNIIVDFRKILTKAKKLKAELRKKRKLLSTSCDIHKDGSNIYFTINIVDNYLDISNCYDDKLFIKYDENLTSAQSIIEMCYSYLFTERPETDSFEIEMSDNKFLLQNKKNKILGTLRDKTKGE